MKHLFVPVEIALLAKEKGVKGYALRKWVSTNKSISEAFLCDSQFDSMLHDISVDKIKSGYYYICDALLYQEIVDYFRKKHNIIIEILLDQTSTVKWAVSITKWNGFADFVNFELDEWCLYRDYYEAMDIAIKRAFKEI